MSILEDKGWPYADILNHPHFVSVRHPRMSAHDRAAQFSPFAALTGYGAVVDEAARLTDQKIELDEGRKALLDMRLRLLESLRPDTPEADFTYFLPDGRKAGGCYVTVSSKLKRIDELRQAVILMDGTHIPTENILQIQCEALYTGF
jgi:hypothetical protein